MDRVSSIFARFEPTHSRTLTSDVIGHVLPRVSVGGGGVFSEQDAVKIPPLRTRLPSITRARANPSCSPIAECSAPVAPQQTPLDYLIEASFYPRMNSVAACKPKSANPTRSETCIPVQPKTAELPVPLSAPLPQLASQVVPSSKTTNATVPNGPKPKRKRIRLKTPRRREQCRTNQARYRKKQTEYAKTLEVTVGQLRLEIPKLEMQHRQLVSNAKTSLWNVVVEYFHLFRNGSRSMGPRSSGPKAWLQTSEAEQQLLFLRSVMMEDVLIGEQRGVEALVDLWKRCTHYFDDLHFRLKHMTKVSENFIAATASLTVTVSEATLQLCLPSNEEFRRNTAQEAKMATVRSKLLGQRLVFPCRLSFEYNEATKRIVRLENSVDLLSSLIQVLGSIEDAAFVLERALLTSS